MAYQNVGTPRFYINDIDYAKSVGLNISDLPAHVLASQVNPYSPSAFGVENYYKIINSNPSKPMIYDFTTQQTWVRYKVIERPENPANYVAYLNHNMATTKVNIRHAYRELVEDDDNSWNGGNGIPEEIINADNGGITFNNGTHSTFITPSYDGFSICGINDATDGYNGIHDFQIKISDDDYNNGEYLPKFQMGSIWVGRYYNMPHSPELDIAMTIENDGYDAITTQGGAHLNNIRYNGAPMWERADGSEIPPWTIGEPTAVGRRRGRRVWSMNFKYLSDKDLFASNYMSNNYTESSTGYDSADLTTDADGNDIFEYALNEDDSFHAQVLNKIGNGQRFIFQPDNNNFNPDQFAICQLQQDSLNIKQVGYGVYNISLKIREVW